MRYIVSTILCHTAEVRIPSILAEIEPESSADGAAAAVVAAKEVGATIFSPKSKSADSVAIEAEAIFEPEEGIRPRIVDV